MSRSVVGSGLLLFLSSNGRSGGWGRGRRLWGRSRRKTADTSGSVGAAVFGLVLGWCRLGGFGGSRSVQMREDPLWSPAREETGICGLLDLWWGRRCCSWRWGRCWEESEGGVLAGSEARSVCREAVAEEEMLCCLIGGRWGGRWSGRQKGKSWVWRRRECWCCGRASVGGEVAEMENGWEKENQKLRGGFLVFPACFFF